MCHYMYLGKVAVSDLLRFCWKYHRSSESKYDLGTDNRNRYNQTFIIILKLYEA